MDIERGNDSPEVLSGSHTPKIKGITAFDSYLLCFIIFKPISTAQSSGEKIMQIPTYILVREFS